MMWPLNPIWGSEHYCYFSPVFCSDCFHLYSHEGTTVEFFDPVSLFQVLSCCSSSAVHCDWFTENLSCGILLNLDTRWMLLPLLSSFSPILQRLVLVFDLTCIVLLVHFWRVKVLWTNKSVLIVLITDTFLQSLFPSSTKLLMKSVHFLSCREGRCYFWSKDAHQLNIFILCSMKQVPRVTVFPFPCRK